MSKLTDRQRIEIRRRYATGTATQRALAAEYGVTQGAIHYVLNA